MKTLSMKNFVNRGRFGNQLFQYSFLKIASWEKGYSLEIPEWAGKKIFESINDPLPKNDFPSYVEKDNFFFENSSIIPRLNENFSMDVDGHFLFHTSFFAKHKEKLLETYKVKEEYEREYSKILERFKKSTNKKNLVGIHYRLTDYRGGARLIAPKNWYQSVLEKIEDYVLFTSSDEPDVAKQIFGGYSSKEIGLPSNTPFADFFQDFWLLSHCDYVLCSDSTFSFFATMLNKNIIKVYKPLLYRSCLVEFDPWNSHVSDLRTRDRINKIK